MTTTLRGEAWSYRFDPSRRHLLVTYMHKIIRLDPGASPTRFSTTVLPVAW